MVNNQKAILITDRLYLRYFTVEDAQTMYEYRSDKECGKYQLWTARDLPSIKEFLLSLEGCTLKDPSLQIAVILKETDQHIGDIYVARNARTITIGYTISPKHQRKGYAFEMISAFITYIHETYPHHEIVAMAHPNNAASLHLLTKLGFKNEGYFEGVDSVVFSLYSQQKR